MGDSGSDETQRGAFHQESTELRLRSRGRGPGGGDASSFMRKRRVRWPSSVKFEPTTSGMAERCFPSFRGGVVALPMGGAAPSAAPTIGEVGDICERTGQRQGGVAALLWGDDKPPPLHISRGGGGPRTTRGGTCRLETADDDFGLVGNVPASAERYPNPFDHGGEQPLLLLGAGLRDGRQEVCALRG